MLQPVQGHATKDGACHEREATDCHQLPLSQVDNMRSCGYAVYSNHSGSSISTAGQVVESNSPLNQARKQGSHAAKNATQHYIHQYLHPNFQGLA